VVGLPCLNCGNPTDPDNVKLFAQVFVCPDCYTIAERLLTRGEQTLTLLRSLLKSSVRMAILEKKLQFIGQAAEDMPDVDFLGELSRLAQQVRQEELQKAKAGCPNQTSSSTTSVNDERDSTPKAPTKLPVPSTGGKPSSSSPSG